jgi:hypothetical protein
MSSLLNVVSRNFGDAAADDLVERNSSAECSGGEDADFGHNVVSLHIVSRIWFRVALCLRIAQRSGVLEALSHQREYMIRRPVQDPTDCQHAGSSQTFCERAQHGSARHDRGLHAALDTVPPSEREQLDRRRSARAFAGCDDVRITLKRLSDVAEGWLRLTGVGIARFSHHIALGLRETLQSGLPPARAWVISQWASRGRKFE